MFPLYVLVLPTVYVIHVWNILDGNIYEWFKIIHEVMSVSVDWFMNIISISVPDL